MLIRFPSISYRCLNGVGWVHLHLGWHPHHPLRLTAWQQLLLGILRCWQRNCLAVCGFAFEGVNLQIPISISTFSTLQQDHVLACQFPNQLLSRASERLANKSFNLATLVSIFTSVRCQRWAPNTEWILPAKAEITVNSWKTLPTSNVWWICFKPRRASCKTSFRVLRSKRSATPQWLCAPQFVAGKLDQFMPMRKLDKTTTNW